MSDSIEISNIRPNKNRAVSMQIEAKIFSKFHVCWF